MRCSSLLVSALAAVSTALKVDGPRVDNPSIPGAYIFEFEENSDIADLHVKAAAEGKERMRFDFKLFKGVSIQFDDVDTAEDKAAKLASLPAVKSSWPVRLYSIPEPRVEWIGSPEKEYVNTRKRSVNETLKDTFSPHVMTQVDKLRAEGITGKGVKIAVIDTGIDYGHPALGGCFGPDCLVSFGTDFVGDDYNGFNTPVPDDDPIDCSGHGTHVAGIVAAQENAFGFTGAAPDVNLGAYRAFGCDGDSTSDILIAAFNQAYEDGADIITASVGDSSGWSEEPWAVIVSRIVEQGVPCTVSAGNGGHAGLFYASTAANGKRVAAIASFDNINWPSLLPISHFSVDGGEEQDFGFTPGVPSAWAGVKLPLWATSFDPEDPAGGCDAYPEDTPDLSGYIVLARRGSCTFVQKAQNAANAGAKYLMLFNNVNGTVHYDVSQVKDILASGMVQPSQGAEWLALLKAGKEVVLDMVDPNTADFELIEIPNTASGGGLSAYTSWGPTFEMDIKPQFGTPGGSILSTWPRKHGSYAVLSGTSMSCPLAAAIFALVSQVRGTLDPETIENALSANANPQLFNDGTAFYNYLAPVAQQGAGLVQAWDAAHATTLLTPSSLAFNDTDNFVESLNFTLSNTGKKEITYEISHVPAITMYTFKKGTIYTDSFPNEAVGAPASFKLSEDKVTLAAGEKVTIEVVATPPSDLAAERLPVWSGWFAINATDGTSLSIPYQGLTGSLHNATVLGGKDGWIAKLTDTDAKPVPANTTFILPPPGSFKPEYSLETMAKLFLNDTSVSIPQLTWDLAMGSLELRADIVAVENSSSALPSLPVEDFFGTKSLGQPVGFPALWVSNNLKKAAWFGQLEKGGYIPEGTYQIVYRALHIFGDEEKEEEWDVATSVPFRIEYKKSKLP